jgi:UDP-N-acetylmuramyl pentapeptide phosphotransferase/UDP-N-acetylglucosamine-1-phosphate transferase
VIFGYDSMNFNSMEWFNADVLIFTGLSLFLNILVVYAWHKKFYQKFGLKTYQAIQRIHLNETPRLGGFIFVLSLIGYVIYSHPTENILLLKLILLSLTPILITGFKEDIFHNVDPAIRLLSLLFVGWLFMANFSGPLPNISEVSFLEKLVSLHGGVSVFYILCMAAIANGMNLIDGVNGLCGAAALSILASLLFLSYKTADTSMLALIFSVMLLFTPFMLINYPKGLIFLGDLGAYSIGLIISILTIILFGRHPEISPWGAVLILIYPVTEVVFSMLRRIFSGVSIFDPDKSHLHLKLFYFFKPKPSYHKIANALVTITLSGLWLFPLLAISWVYHKLLFIWAAIILFMIFYGVLYAIIPNVKQKLARNSKSNRQ